MPSLAAMEEALAGACALLARRAPHVEAALRSLGEAHVQAAATLRLAEAPLWRRALGRLRAAAQQSDALEWLRDQELELARRYTALQHPGAAGAWQRYLYAERLVLLHEFGELAPT